ncbi:siphovirus Gp157 family protein [Myxococcota bacterium]|nr:siphovirus Gp157 family protein [Myxococcota bacterium]
MPRLYEIAHQYRALADAADDGEDVADELARCEGDLTAKATAMAAIIRGLRSDAEALREEEKRLAARRRALEANDERIRAYVLEQLDAAGIARVKTPLFTWAVMDGPERVEVEDEAAIPAEYQRTRVDIDRAAVLAAWKRDGEVVPGTRVVRGRVLRMS